MENFVLNLFSDQLSKIIYNFHESQINANFLSGKGSITNVKLNVGLINDFLNKPPHGTVPFLEFTEITLSELRVEVTSYTNLKKAPIVLVIEEIHAKAREPLEYHVDPAANAQHKRSNAASSPPAKKASAPQQYGLLHRILDNLSVKIKRIHLSFSSLGKFKTRRRGIWSPPTLQVSFDNVEWICVTEEGNPGTPEMVWAHNELGAQQSRFKRDQSNNQHRHRSYIIYKRLSMMCHVKLLPYGDDPQSKGLQFNAQAAKSSESVSNLISDTKIDVYLAYIRRLRDASVTGADLDVQVHGIDINLDVDSYDKTSSKPTGCDVGAFLHMMIGLLHCYYKDRSFVDPLLPKGVKAAKSDGTKGGLLRGFRGPNETENPDEEEDDEAGPDDFLPEVALMDDDLDSSDESDYEDEPDEEHDEAFLAWKRKEDEKEGREPEADEVAQSLTASRKERETQQLSSEDQSDKTDQTAAKSYKRKRKAVIVIASGAQKFEKLTFSLSVPRVNMKLCLPKESMKDSPPEGDDADSDSTHHCLELLLEGLVAECIWPKNRAGEMGGHVQGSIRYFHLLESAYRKGWGSESGTFGPQPWNVVRMCPLLRVGTRLFQGHNSFALSPRLQGPMDVANSVSKCDEFPLMESRETTWRWDRRLTGPRAFAFKSTISFVEETLTLWSRTSVQHEASLGELEVVLDSAPIERLVNLFANPGDKDNVWFDDRWLSGDWHTAIPADIVVANDADFRLNEHLQPLPSLYPTSTKQSPLSSELRSITAHFDSVTVRLPNPQHDLLSFRMADVVFAISEATILVSSDLPSSFLSGAVTPENTSHEFPHDASDISCIAGAQCPDVKEEPGTIFRMQISISDCSLKIVPTTTLGQDEEFGIVLVPTNVTMMMSLEHSKEESSLSAQQSLIVSVLVHQVESNVELRSVYCALETIKYHFGSLIKGAASSGGESNLNASKSTDAIVESSNSSSIICIHVPEVKVNVWGERAQKSPSLNFSEVETEGARLNHSLLCKVKASLFEFGMDFTKRFLPLSETAVNGAIYKCSIDTVSVDICSRMGDDDGDGFEMMNLLSLGSSSLVESANAYCSPGDVVGSKSTSGFLLRSENESIAGTPSTSASAVEITSPLVLDFNINAIELFLNQIVGCLVAPVFVGSTSRPSQIGQTPLGSAMWSIIFDYFASSQSHVEEVAASNGVKQLFRMSFCQLLVLVPSESYASTSYGLFFSDVELAVGDSHCSKPVPTQVDLKGSTNYRRVIDKQCGIGGRTWLNEFYLLDKESAPATDSNTFHALKGKHTLLRVYCEKPQGSRQFNVILPEASIHYSMPEGLGGASAPPFDVYAMKDLGMICMNMGMPLSSLYFKLYKLSPESDTSQSDFSLAATRLHNELGTYHTKISTFVYKMNAEIGRLREAVFSKENERIGALALASSTAAGWIRVGEDLSFSHRIFSSATFHRYWMVIDRGLLILSGAPGASPSFIIPLRASSQLRSLSMSSSSNKAASGIVSKHVQGKGFALFDSTQGIGLFFVASTDSDRSMWMNAISRALKKEETKAPDAIQSATDQVVPPRTARNEDPTNLQKEKSGPVASESQGVAPFGVLEGVSATATPPPATDSDPSHSAAALPAIVPPADTVGDQFGEAPATEDLSPTPAVPLDPFESMDEEDMMDDISLSGSDAQNDFAAFEDNVSPTDVSLQQPLPPVPPMAPSPPEPRTREESQAVTTQPLPMRERLALAKGKTKLASSKFGLALKTAKGGVLAASEVGRDGMKQAMAKEAPARKEEMARRSLATMSVLKEGASSRLAAARSSVQDQISARTGDVSETADAPGLSSRKIVVGQKFSSLKQNATSKLASVRTSIQDQQSLKTASSESETGVPSSSSQDEFSATRSSKQAVRKKLANLDQSMSSTMRRLKLDEKIAAVKSAAMNDPVVKQLSQSRHSESSRQRLGIGEAVKPIKFDARETFGASSELPLKLKSNVACGGLVDADISESINSLEKIAGSWVVAVDAVKAPPPSTELQTEPTDSWNYHIIVTDVGCDNADSAQVSVGKHAVLAFHTKLSEIMSKHLPSTAEYVAQEGLAHVGTTNSVLKKLAPLERLRVSGMLLQRILDEDIPSLDSSSSALRDRHCESMKVFVSTLLECHMPHEAIKATKDFLNIDVSSSDNSDDYGTYLANGAHYVNEAFNNASHAMKENGQLANQGGNPDARSDRETPLLNALLGGYLKAIKERDEALASLSTTSIMNDNSILQGHLAKSNGASVPKPKSSDEDMMNICKQLGNEISLRTAAETEIHTLRERLEFERQIAEAKEKELRAELSRYKKMPY